MYSWGCVNTVNSHEKARFLREHREILEVDVFLNDYLDEKNRFWFLSFSWKFGSVNLDFASCLLNRGPDLTIYVSYSAFNASIGSTRCAQSMSKWKVHLLWKFQHRAIFLELCQSIFHFSGRLFVSMCCLVTKYHQNGTWKCANDLIIGEYMWFIALKSIPPQKLRKYLFQKNSWQKSNFAMLMGKWCMIISWGIQNRILECW